MGYIEELVARKKVLLTELNGINMILGVYEKKGEQNSEPKLRGASQRPNNKHKKLPPSVATEAFDFLEKSFQSKSINEIYQELLNRGIKCKLDSVSQIIRRHKHHFVKGEDQRWRILESPNEESPGDSKIHGEVAESV